MTQSTPRLSAATLARRIGALPTGGPTGGPGGGADGSPTGGQDKVRSGSSESGGPGMPTYRALASRIRGAVLDGRLAVDTGLPSERDLALGMSVSRTTVAAAYSLLREEGWLDSRRGSGSRLRLPDGPGAAAAPGPGPRGIFGTANNFDGADDLIDLTTASLPAPAEPLARAAAAAVESLGRYGTGDGYFPFGVPVLRQAIAERYTADGTPTSADQILVTNGAQHALNLVLSELSSPGDRVMIECPTYPVALDAIRAHHRIPGPLGMSVPADPAARVSAENPWEIWDMELVTATLRQTAPRLAYLIPDFHNPTGALMNDADRQQLVRAARRSGTVLVIDESFRDVPFPGTGPLPAHVAALGDDARVISLGSVSKSIWGGLRTGWIRAAPSLVARLAAARALGDMAGPVLDQLVVAHLLADPEPAFGEQAARLAAGARALLEALAADLPDWRPLPPRGGASLWVRLPAPFATELARIAPAAGVRIAPGPRFGPDGTMESYLRLPFTAAPDRLQAATRRLAVAAEQAGTGRSAQLGAARLPGWVA